MKQYIAPLCENFQLDPLMDNLDIAATSNVEKQTADAPGRSNGLKYL